MGPINATLNCLMKPFRFAGRASRSEFWWFTLIYMAAIFALSIWMMLPMMQLGFEAGQAGQAGQATVAPADMLIAMERLYSRSFYIVLALLWPMFSQLSVTIRRLHDSDHSGWWYWIGVIPLIGTIILLILMVVPGDGGRNRFGPRPGGPAPRRAVEPATLRNPVDAYSSAEDLRALRQSRMGA